MTTLHSDALREAIGRAPVVPMLTEPVSPAVPDVVRALAGAGVEALEITLSTDGALAAVERSAHVDGCLVGAGTVLTPEIARSAVDAGADYLLTPGVLPNVAGEAQRLGVPLVCGAFTLTEVLAADSEGAQGIKIFPAWLGGPAYVASITSALPHIQLVPTGGVGIDDIDAYFAAGAAGVALGRAAVGDALRGGPLDQVHGRAADVLARARAARQGTR